MDTKMLRIMLGILAVAMAASVPVAPANQNDILIVPARARMVRLGIDLQALRGPTLISYNKTDDPLRPWLHVWNRSSRSWQRLDISQNQQPRNLPHMPNRVYVIGLPGDVPAVMVDGLAHAHEIKRLQTLSVAEILTAVDQDMQFSIREWHALAQRYDLEITERKQEERRWGRFGPPRRYRVPRQPEAQQHTMETPDITAEKARTTPPEQEDIRPEMPTKTTLPQREEDPHDEIMDPVSQSSQSKQTPEKDVDPPTQTDAYEHGEPQDFPIK